MGNKKRACLFGLAWLLIGSAYASIPASTAYVDQQIAKLKAEILQMINYE